jgi:uncharacterized protein (TIGR02145 family)
MRSLVFVLVFSLGFGVVHAQSKKEMIVLLNSRVDSLSQVVANERPENTRLTTKIVQLEAAIKRLENEKSALDVNLEAQRKLKDAQIKSKQDSLALVVKELLLYKPAPPKVEEKLIVAQDVSGPIKTVTIGKQVWMLENLNVATFKNGVAIPEVQEKDAWESANDNKQAAWCYYDIDPKNGEKYGKLYNWYAVVDDNGLCPQGWHIPSDAEWTGLIDYLGGSQIASGKMKEVGIVNWNSPNTESTNLSLFTGLPGGTRSYGGNYSGIGGYGNWWSSTENKEIDTNVARYFYLGSNAAYGNDASEGDGLSVRCLRD